MNVNDAAVVFYSEQPFVVETLISAFGKSPGFRLAAVHDTLEATLEFLGKHSADADIVLLNFNGELTLSILQRIKRSAPLSKLVVWTHAISNEMAFQAMELGVRGIFPSSLTVDQFMAALRSVQAGEPWFEKELMQGFFDGKRIALTRREGQLVALLAQGLRNKEIAFSLQIGEGTVKVYLSRLFRKLGVSDRFELALYGLKNLAMDYPSLVHRYGPNLPERMEPDLPAPHSILIGGLRIGPPARAKVPTIV
jgi:DNA-binding NarL/FixJ family response regulator